MSDGPFSFSGWEPFLPKDAVLMAKKGVASNREVVLPRFAFIAPGFSRPGHRELFEKIVSALNLAPSDFCVVERDENPLQAKLIRFSAEEGESVGVTPSGLTTYSLSAMLKNPGLKKLVWSHLKEVFNQ